MPDQCWTNVNTLTMTCCEQLQPLPNAGPTIAFYLGSIPSNILNKRLLIISTFIPLLSFISIMFFSFWSVLTSFMIVWQMDLIYGFSSLVLSPTGVEYPIFCMGLRESFQEINELRNICKKNMRKWDQFRVIHISE